MKIYDGTIRKTWPRPWATVEKVLSEDLKLDKDVIASIHAGTVENKELPHITEDCVTWPSVQNLVRNHLFDTHRTPTWHPSDTQLAPI